MHSLRNQIKWKYHRQPHFPRMENAISSRIRQGFATPSIIHEFVRKGAIHFVFSYTDPREQQKGIVDEFKPQPINCFLDYELNTTMYRVWERNSNKFVEWDKEDVDNCYEQGLVVRTSETPYGNVLFIVREPDIEFFRSRPIL